MNLSKISQRSHWNVCFRRDAYLVSPITINHDWLKENLKRFHIGLINDRTIIGNDIAICANCLKKSESKTKLIVLFTDGGNTAGNITRSIASETVDALGIKIYIIGIDKTGTIYFAYHDKNDNI
jgi:Ca-activated chloride channel family protein